MRQTLERLADEEVDATTSSKRSSSTPFINIVDTGDTVVAIATAALDGFRSEVKMLCQSFRMDRERREDELNYRSSKKSNETEHFMLNRVTSLQSGGSLKSKQDKDLQEGPALKIAGPEGEIPAESKVKNPEHSSPDDQWRTEFDDTALVLKWFEKEKNEKKKKKILTSDNKKNKLKKKSIEINDEKRKNMKKRKQCWDLRHYRWLAVSNGKKNDWWSDICRAASGGDGDGGYELDPDRLEQFKQVNNKVGLCYFSVLDDEYHKYIVESTNFKRYARSWVESDGFDIDWAVGGGGDIL
ncbi:hypothetical protein DM860_007745 [Cuscuta australis]|uniref:Uncharacterized protein n=1 Tax=Cuscuta australis TaxID=267555 RepID=A0A328E4U5_9ASTE|nr:hypothetical protein DM860_007745 [Cuscuta australis]